MSFAKRGGFLAEVDEALFLELKNNKRIVHSKSTKFPARSLQADIPDSVPVDDFNLQQYMDQIKGVSAEVDSFQL
ncbi:hypothetical protein AD45P2_00540 [Alteromonas phage vB_AmaP_AD45-P2]|uniref:Uncharacterized protein n=1 Tax=Pseudorhizobium pelagicum TaxID=1509405 RepID=A0A922P2B0_9HYPH|nr:hypothetical protein M610_gp075 [Alteromonas phage vB_AmaP_AD45-P1]AGM47041.1 hypothetical protein AD45P3_00515 [Alteromonas phage vB_AmaP_AD45-P3]AGM47157.1 hypothetical protein AD45P4_00510 [Alteromonas phage vB_AmaP_AD45-P4]AGM47279.1 hypothetical protein AD45P2_00540 [Alteromonas phage vB_AmaP_AD45-P2]KEQ05603.1 hypothetical protein GV68_08725 [Pseudorhizobium pelagicum]AGM46924.1 hypothetical protein AD45P1_00530 [Alteromonas phage vB_AmaP_AD45-P1]